jgi:hypothetical protein
MNERNVSDCRRSDVREDPRGDARGAPPTALSIAPVESGAEVMIERDATTARSDAQLYRPLHYSNIVRNIV